MCYGLSPVYLSHQKEESIGIQRVKGLNGLVYILGVKVWKKKILSWQMVQAPDEMLLSGASHIKTYWEECDVNIVGQITH